jgi:Plasmid pRiA4b ORF-3-like protein
MLLAQLHEVMQIAFEWHHCHLHSFETVCGEFGTPDEETSEHAKTRPRQRSGR